MRVIYSLRNDQSIVVQRLCDDIPWFIAAFFGTTNAEALALADGVIHQSTVLTEFATVYADNFSGLRRNKTLQKIPELAFTDEADSGAVFFRVDHKLLLPGNIAYLRFVQLSYGKQGVCQLMLIQRIEKIRLVLVFIHPA